MIGVDLRKILYEFKGVEDKGITFITSVKDHKYVSYNCIFENALKASEVIKRNNIKKNSKVIFQIDSNELFVYYFWGCIAYGYYPVPLEVAKNVESRNKLINVVNSLNDIVIITTKSQKEKIQKIEDQLSCKIIEAESLENVKDISFLETSENLCDETAFIQFSSGSTGNPKGVMLSHKNLIANISSISKGIALKSDDIGLSWLPLTHDMGLIGFHLTPSAYLVNHVIIDTKVFSLKPSIWLELIYKYKATITCSPNFGYIHLLNYLKRKAIKEEYDLSSIRVLFNGAERISYDIVNEFIQSMRKYNLRDDVVFPVYGLAEASLAAAFPKVNTKVKYLSVDKENLFIGDKVVLKESGVKFVCEGKSVESVKVEVLNDKNEPVENIIGKVYISGKSVTNKFLINDEEVPSLDKFGRLYTGDIGFIFNNEVYIIGRESELIVNGKNYFCTDAEEYINKRISYKYQFVLLPIYDEEEDECCIVVFLKHNYDKEIVDLFKKLRSEVFNEASMRYDGIVFLKSIPKTTSGKIKRFDITNKYLNGKYKDVISLRDKVEDKEEYSKFQIEILDLFEKAYKERPDIYKDVSYLFNESLANVTFLYYVERFYNIKIDIDAFNGLNTVDEICKKVEEYLV